MVEQIVRLAELEIEPVHLKRYTALLKEEIEASIATEPGVTMLYALAVKDSPTQIRIMEIYESLDAYAAHLRSPHFLKYKRETAGMVRHLRLVETTPIALAAKGLG